MQYMLYKEETGELVAWIEDKEVILQNGYNIKVSDNLTVQDKDGKIIANNVETNKMKMKVKFFDKDLYAGDNALKKIGEKSDWIDLRARTDITLKKDEYCLIPLGVAIQLPNGYEAHIVPRSSTFKRWGIIQSDHIGIIDETYCGDDDEWLMPVLAMRDTEIKKGDRICQFRIVEHQPDFDIEVVDSLDNPNRGGIGSTGKN